MLSKSLTASLISTLLMALITVITPATATGKLGKDCAWDKYGRGVQVCLVNSKAMNRKIKVQVRPGNSHQILLLDGARARDDSSIWALHGEGDAPKVLQNNPATLVMPVGGHGSWYTDWDRKGPTHKHIYKWETFLMRELPVFMKDSFGVTPVNNSIAGLSMSAQSAVSLAANYPRQYNHVLAMSGYYPTLSLPLEILLSNIAVSHTGVLDQWGIPYLDNRWWKNNPTLNLTKLKNNGISLTLTSGSGQWVGKNIPPYVLASSGLEIGSAISTARFLATARLLGVKVYDRRTWVGDHVAATWRRALASDATVL